jgi:hypothetical protein
LKSEGSPFLRDQCEGAALSLVRFFAPLKTGHEGKQRNERSKLNACDILLLLRVQKKEQEKDTLFHDPLGYPELLAVVGT